MRFSRIISLMLLGTTLAYPALDAKDPDKGIDKKGKKHNKDPSPAASSPDEVDTTTDKSGKMDKKHDKKEKEGKGEKEKGDKKKQGPIAPIEHGFRNITVSLEGFNKVLKGVTADAPVEQTTVKLLEGSAKILDAMKQATADIKNMKEVKNILDAIDLPKLSDSLIDQTKNVINTLISKKPVIAKAGEAEITAQALSDQKKAATEFGNAIISKLPRSLEKEVEKNARKASDAIQKGIDAFKG
jgi:hydrophobic surface binding protein A